jgi:acetyl-CoA acetyltransferase
MQDSLAVDSHRRAANAIAKSYFKEQILPIPVEAKRGIAVFDCDEHTPGSILAIWVLGRSLRSKKALERAGLKIDHIDIIEANEAFAAQACAVAIQLGFDPEVDAERGVQLEVM